MEHVHTVWTNWIEGLIQNLPTILGVLVGVVLVAWIGSYLVRRLVARTVKQSSNMPSVEQEQRIDTLQSVSVGSLKVVVGLVGLMILFTELGVDIGPLLATAGVAGVALGFGAQYLIKDIITGFFVLTENQYGIGDVVCINDVCGAVEDVTLRITKLRDLDGTVHHIPNSEIKVASNMSKKFSRVNLNVGVAYDSDIDTVIEVINRVGEELSEDDEWKEDIIEPPQFLRVDEFGDSSVNLKVLGEVKPAKQWDVTGELRRRLKEEFDNADITIPFPQRTLHQESK